MIKKKLDLSIQKCETVANFSKKGLGNGKLYKKKKSEGHQTDHSRKGLYILYM